jgi:hypothetical protein
MLVTVAWLIDSRESVTVEAVIYYRTGCPKRCCPAFFCHPLSLTQLAYTINFLSRQECVAYLLRNVAHYLFFTIVSGFEQRAAVAARLASTS